MSFGCKICFIFGNYVYSSVKELQNVTGYM